jgi:hypothetical protein
VTEVTVKRNCNHSPLNGLRRLHGAGMKRLRAVEVTVSDTLKLPASDADR